MEKILVIKKLNILTFFLTLLLYFLKIKVFYYHSSDFFLRPYFVKVLEKISIYRVNLEDCDDIGVQPYLGREGDYTDQIVSNLLDSSHITKFSSFFEKINNVDSKLYLLIKKFVTARLINNEVYYLSLWLNGMHRFRYDHKIYLLWNFCSIREDYITRSCKDINVKIVASTNLFILFEFVQKVSIIFLKKIIGLLRKLFLFKKKIDTVDNTTSVINNVIDTSPFEVLFFPHQSIFYGNLCIKDYFYNKDKGSIFHPSNILHVEFGNIDLDEEKSKYYHDNEITTVLFPKPNISQYYKNFRYVINSIGFVNSLSLLRKNVLLFFVLLLNSVIFLTKRKAVNSSFPNAKIVLVGYEILFSQIVSLVFESLSVKTVATQERFTASAIYENWPFIIDTYFASSDFACKKIEQSANKFVNQCIPIGQVRTDLIEKFKKSELVLDNLIVVFDYHSEKNRYENMKNPVNNWSANKAFYEDMCKLAKKFSDIDIVIRGKNTDWTKISFFKDTLDKIKSIPNLSISTDYSSPNIQYRLASKAKLIIAKHTSIGDELIASGKPVIFHDFSPNISKGFYEEFNYNKADIFVHSYEALEAKVENIINENYFLSNAKFLELQKILNNGPADGKVKERIDKELDILSTEESNL